MHAGAGRDDRISCCTNPLVPPPRRRPPWRPTTRTRTTSDKLFNSRSSGRRSKVEHGQCGYQAAVPPTPSPHRLLQTPRCLGRADPQVSLSQDVNHPDILWYHLLGVTELFAVLPRMPPKVFKGWWRRTNLGTNHIQPTQPAKLDMICFFGTYIF